MEKTSISLLGGEHVSAIIHIPLRFQAGRNSGIILAHGAGNDMETPLLVFLAEGLARSGVLALRFNFPYKQAGRNTPDKPEVLESTWEAACFFLLNHPRYRPAFLLAAGKSMGGRIASQAAASGRLPVQGLIFYGYPLHPPGHPEKLRDAHLVSLSIPMLFFEGTRDPFCDLKLLEAVRKKMKAPGKLEIIEGGNHSFEVPKSRGQNLETIYQTILDKTLGFIESGLFDPSPVK
jgi:uncharacterized protein